MSECVAHLKVIKKLQERVVELTEENQRLASIAGTVLVYAQEQLDVDYASGRSNKQPSLVEGLPTDPV